MCSPEANRISSPARASYPASARAICSICACTTAWDRRTTRRARSASRAQTRPLLAGVSRATTAAAAASPRTSAPCTPDEMRRAALASALSAKQVARCIKNTERSRCVLLDEAQNHI
eukprot:6186420-Pleurochrysis_carterae.AAC.1